ncbi:hypothetical protein Ae201684_002247 [Aphanomyces euteiches]|uniref:Uncharacterized protein n=1 Tax=Aphanomyces euteiches TaxID=100861 RepID=A0A6G0XR95_9STRA|nr:hypothetical protein Ae201684_002247 [Aphanomyces euteiches]
MCTRPWRTDLQTGQRRISIATVVIMHWVHQDTLRFSIFPVGFASSIDPSSPFSFMYTIFLSYIVAGARENEGTNLPAACRFTSLPRGST